MLPLHVDSDQLYLAARSIWQTSYQASDQIFELRVALYRLEMAWQGAAADEFLDELGVWIDRMDMHMEELNALGLTLSHQAEAWDECDQRWAGSYRESSAWQPGE
jgi:WXG100 family type VII secretion target